MVTGGGSPVLAIATGVPIIATHTAPVWRPVRAPALLADAIAVVGNKSLGITYVTWLLYSQFGPLNVASHPVPAGVSVGCE